MEHDKRTLLAMGVTLNLLISTDRSPHYET
ncbi:hypothetical protein H4V99_002960 [Cryobacterium sp. CG_9.6]|nr:hypothetical protein [Cryobacterium sp. CG_9.6]